MSNYDFKKDFPIAKETEKEIANLLIEKYGTKILSYNDDYRYDLLVEAKSKKIKLEIKEDFTGENTGNCAVEFFSRDKDSGIRTTEADYYIYKLHTKSNGIQFVLYSVDSIKKMIDDNIFFAIVCGGDKGSDSYNYLFKYETFIKGGKILFV